MREWPRFVGREGYRRLTGQNQSTTQCFEGLQVVPVWEYVKINLNEVPRKGDDMDLLGRAAETAGS
jgi:hypothetical protein